jgi:hypothetical protein
LDTPLFLALHSPFLLKTFFGPFRFRDTYYSQINQKDLSKGGGKRKPTNRSVQTKTELLRVKTSLASKKHKHVFGRLFVEGSRFLPHEEKRTTKLHKKSCGQAKKIRPDSERI